MNVDVLSCFFCLRSVQVYEQHAERKFLRALFYLLAVTSKVPAIGLLPYYFLRSYLRCPGKSAKEGRSNYRGGPCKLTLSIKDGVLFSLRNHVYELVITLIAFSFSYNANVVSESHGLTTIQIVTRACYSSFWYLYRTVSLNEPNIVYPVPDSDFSLWSIEFVVILSVLSFGHFGDHLMC